MRDSEIRTKSLEKMAQDLVREHVDIPIVRVEKIALGVMTLKYVVELDSGQRYVVRFYPSSRSEVVQYEPDILRRCFAAQIFVPEVVADSRSSPKAPLEYMIYRWIEGVPLADRLPMLAEDSLAEVARSLVACMGRLHEIEVAGYGELVDGARARSTSWESFLEDSFRLGINATMNKRLVSKEVLEKLRFVQEHLGKFSTLSRTGLVWGDISPEHVLLDKHDRLTGLVDLESILAGDILLNLGYAYARYSGTRLFEALLRAWSCRLEEDLWAKIELYAILRALRILEHSHRPLPTGEARMPIQGFLPGLDKAIDGLCRRISTRSEIMLSAGGDEAKGRKEG
jgi:aminoglycoside phosphotransferase (APT) family kinase protein